MPGRKRTPRRDSERCSIVNRTVSFNVEDPVQLRMLEHADKWVNFSGAIKRLLTADMGTESVGKVHRSVEFMPRPTPHVECEDDQLAELFGAQ